MMKNSAKNLTIAFFLMGSLGSTTGCEEKNEDSTSQEPTAVSAKKAHEDGVSPESGDQNDDTRYSVVSPKSEVPVGESARVSLQIEPGSGFKINREYPWKLTFEAPKGTSIASTSVTKDAIDLADARATIPIELTAETPGTHELKAVANFSVCNDERCEILRDRRLTFAVNAVEADAKGVGESEIEGEDAPSGSAE